ncbi:MAG: dTMP kinase [Alistipes sp.]
MFIVLEGLDGAGKSTQIKMLRDMLAQRGTETEYVHFPRFDAPIYGDLIARFLRGELGSLEQVNPYIVALLYAGDRADMAAKIREWLAADKVVIADRYVYSNIGYQCAKLADGGERRRLKDWILHLEYGYNRIPRPDVSLFLDVPFAFTVKKLTDVREGDDRNYLKGGSDIHEASLSLQECVRRVYLEAAEEDEQLKVIDCSNDEGGMASPEQIFQRIERCIMPLFDK